MLLLTSREADLPVFGSGITLGHRGESGDWEEYCSINYDPLLQTFVYQHRSEQPVAIEYPPSLALAVRYAEVNKWLGEAGSASGKGERVRELEIRTAVVMPRTPGQDREDPRVTFAGYSMWLRAFLEMSDVGPETDLLLAKAVDALRGIQQRFGGPVSAHVEQGLEVLKNRGEAYFAGGTEDHLTIGRIQRKPDGKHTLTIYNAGFEAPRTGRGEEVKSVQEWQILDSSDVALERLLTLIYKKQEVSSTDKEGVNRYNTEIRRYLGKELSFECSSPQHRGNCTTRSIREFLKSLLGEGVVGELHGYMGIGPYGTQEEINDFQKVINQMVGRKKEIEDTGLLFLPPAEGRLPFSHFMLVAFPDKQGEVVLQDCGDKIAIIAEEGVDFSRLGFGLIEERTTRNGPYKILEISLAEFHSVAKNFSSEHTVQYNRVMRLAELVIGGVVNREGEYVPLLGRVMTREEKGVIEVWCCDGELGRERGSGRRFELDGEKVRNAARVIGASEVPYFGWKPDIESIRSQELPDRMPSRYGGGQATGRSDR